MEGVNVSYFGYVRTYDLHDHCRHLKCQFGIPAVSSKFKYWGMLGYTVRQIPKKNRESLFVIPKKVIHRWRYIYNIYCSARCINISISILGSQSTHQTSLNRTHKRSFQTTLLTFITFIYLLFNNIDEKRGPFQTVLSQKSEHTQPLS